MSMGGCVDCGYNSHAAALQFDHVDPVEKSFIIAHGASKARQTVIDEMAKCVLRCSNCHAIRTYEQAQTKKRTRVLDTLA